MSKKNGATKVKNDCRNCPNVKKKVIKYIVPSKINDTEIKNLFLYFLYFAPNIDSVHHSSIPDTENHDAIFREMTDNAKTLSFYVERSSVDNNLQKKHLANNYVCLKCVRAICQKKESTETDLDCFLRHIRNSIAHGRIVYCHESNRHYIMFEDVTPNGNISARIVCNKSCLLNWRRILEKYSTKS